jgi:LPS export ABC transporter protein LptC
MLVHSTTIKSSTKKPLLNFRFGDFCNNSFEFKIESTTLKADYGVRYETSKRMEVKYNVEVVNANGEKLNTEHLTWNAITKKIYTDDFVKITTKDQVIWGDGMEADQDFSDYQIKNVKGEIYTKDSTDTDKKVNN